MVTPYVPAPSYNMDPIDVWGNFQQGMQIGGALRQRARERQYGEAYRQGGFGAVAETAGGMGDLETAESAGTVAEQRRDTAAQRAQRNASVLSNAATSLMSMPYEQRRPALERMTPMLEQMGLDPAQIAQFDPTDENLQSYRALAGQFSRFTDIQQQGDAIVGITADGRVEILSPGPFQGGAGFARAHRINPQTGEVELGGELPLRPRAADAGAAAPALPQGFAWED